MFGQRQTNIENIAQVLRAMLYVVMLTPDDNTGVRGHSYPTLKMLLPYLGVQGAHQRNPSYPTFISEVICWLRGKLSPTKVGLLDVIRAALYVTKRATERAGRPRTSCNFERIFLTPPSGPHIGAAWQNSVQNVNARGTIYSIWIILHKCEGCCEARLARRVEQIW